jgi:hypothetical protein
MRAMLIRPRLDVERPGRFDVHVERVFTLVALSGRPLR